ncbi:MAG TPA: fatty acid cis/trans isomerase, partial [Nannocystaceae bacterium]|nr:fatty acid cis/trans isomerase [Nannocystaceae bacterium]
MRARAHFVLLLCIAVACGVYQQRRLDRRFGEAHVRDRVVATVAAGAIDYERQVRPILESRCVVCHACYDAPCQLDLGSPEGIERGGSKQRVYESTRLLQADLTRLFEDAHTTTAWRKKGFHPVLNERAQTPKANRFAGLMYRSLELKRAHPVRPGTLLSNDVDLGLRHEEKCPTIEEVDRHARKHPQWGMPYGLPGLSPEEHAIVTRWLAEGALHGPTPALPQRLASLVAHWEAFLNEDSLAARLASRYIYEHLFLAHLWLEDGRSGSAPQYFELVRSKTPPGRPIERIATRRPYDDPGVARPYYRLEPVREAIVAKLHLPYRLDDARMKRWRELFRDPDYRVDALPSYSPKVASNPFVAFRAIPARSRYRFMLDEAEFTLMGFIKGAVCRGPIALNVIDDQFWVFFADPDAKIRLHDAEFLFEHSHALRMPAEESSNARPLATWLRRSKDEKAWAAAKQKALREDLAGRITLDLLWDGDGDNRNATLTVFRHFDSASVVKGMVGGPPKTAWVIDYPMLERIHYLLVAGFDVYGNIGHQLSTRAYMDFLRMESEFEFLALLPAADRKRERAFWYRDTNERAYREIVDELADLEVESGIRYETDDPKRELYGRLWRHFAPVREDRYGFDEPALPQDIATPLRELAALTGRPLRWVPQTAFVLVPDAPRGAQVFTIIRNDGHSNIASPFSEDDRRRPLEDTLTVARGFIGTYPNAFF